MPRIAAPELEDFDWFPVPLRDAMTGWLRVVSELGGVSTVAAPLVLEAMDSIGTNRIIDLCSGGGGPVISLVQMLARNYHRDVVATLTDKFPNAPAFARAEAEAPSLIEGRLTVTDATAVPPELVGVRTIFNAFHHLPPPVAKAVLADAARARQPIITFEFVERSAQGALILAGLPLGVYGLMPLVRSASPLALALTYLLPVVPLATLWDGAASCLRAYSVPELEAMVADLGTDDYTFRIERVRVPGRPIYVTSVIGMPC